MDMELICPKCDETRTPDDVNYDTGKVCCAICGSRIEVKGDPPSESDRPPASQLIKAPKELQVEQDGSRLRITVRRPELYYCRTIALAFSIAWFLMIGAGWVFLLADALNALGAWEVLGALAGGLGLLLFYGFLVGILNRKVVIATPNRLKVRQQPLPWVGTRTVAKDRMNQVFVKSRWHRTRHRIRYRSYQLRVVLRNNREIVLLRRLGSLQEALYIEQAIEQHFGLIDQPVAGGISQY